MDRFDLLSYINEEGIKAKIITMESKVHTAQAAAEELDVKPSQIIKSLVFMADGLPITVITTGDSRVDKDKLKEVVGVEKCRLASKEEVEESTGYSVGEVPPIGIDMPVYIDRKVMNNEVVYGGGGSNKHLLKILPKTIKNNNQAKIVEITE